MFSFCKMQATGNDFVIVDCTENEFEYSLPVLTKFLCDRHYGVGADGTIFLEKSETADFKMRIFNHDGTEAEMCGNGIRCLAKYIFDKQKIQENQFSIETLAGIKNVKLELENQTVLSITVNMGEIEMEHLKYVIEIEEKNYEIYPILIGNPHVVCFVEDVENFEVEKIGPILENYKYFPNRTNVEFVQILDNENIKVRVWERGVGETNSCGTGACASSMIAIQKKLTQNQVTVNLKGGKLQINYHKANNVLTLTGPAETVFEGKIEKM